MTPRATTPWASRLVAALAVVAVVVLGVAGAASAHAGLESASPADGAVVADAPSEITLNFSERVSVQPDGVRVLDADANRRDKGTATASGSTVTVPLDDLSDGGYVVAWRIVSDDGHPVSGTYTFSVGTRTAVASDLADKAFAGNQDGRDRAIGDAARAVVYLAVLGAAGVVLVGAALRRDGDAALVPRLVAVLAGAGIVASLLELPLQASLITGQGWASLNDEGVLRLVLGEGTGWSIGLTVLGLVAIAITAGLEDSAPVRATALVGAVLAPLGLPLTGHTRTMHPAVVGYLADTVHVFAGAVWFGGLLALVLILRRRRAVDDVAGAGDAVATFSGWAAITVALLTVAGGILGWIETGGSWDALTGTSYGKLLLLKVALVGLVLVGAWWNRTRFVPRLTPATTGVDADADADAGSAVVDTAAPVADWSRFGRVLRLEILGIVAVLGVTGALVNLTPAKVSAGRGPIEVSAKMGEGTVRVTADPATVGANELHIFFDKPDGTLDGRYESASVKLSLPSRDLPAIDAPVVRVGPGHFQIVNVTLPFSGAWQVDVAAKLDRFTEVDAAPLTVTIR